MIRMGHAVRAGHQFVATLKTYPPDGLTPYDGCGMSRDNPAEPALRGCGSDID
jgi:hypothetical protein